MQTSGFTWAGAKTEDFAGTVRFFSDVLGLPLSRRDDTAEWAVFDLPSGQRLEVFGPKDGQHDFMQCPVFGFEVEDVWSARKELESKGVEFVTEVKEWAAGLASAYFRGPDGHLYEVWQRPK
jgi:catechol 2,3-dioxygenase-like lactoylglutathione lyase family enzyme